MVVRLNDRRKLIRKLEARETATTVEVLPIACNATLEVNTLTQQGLLFQCTTINKIHLQRIGTATPRSRSARMKVKIKTWNAVATWRWDIPDDDVCGICQIHFDGTCPTCKYPGDDCSLLSGKCGHNFHMHCIVEWIKQDSSKGQCPMCRQKFEWTENTKPTLSTDSPQRIEEPS